MSPRENLLTVLRRHGSAPLPCDFGLCPAQQATFRQRYGETADPAEVFAFPTRHIEGLRVQHLGKGWRALYREPLHPQTTFNQYGVAHEPKAEGLHFTQMRHPLEAATSVEELAAWPWPDVLHGEAGHQADQVRAIHARGLAATGGMQMTIWESAWYLRGMDGLFLDMLEDSPLAQWLFDHLTADAIHRALCFAAAGCDILYLGDDIGMQRQPMMSPDLWRTWLKPRLAAVIAAARREKPDILVAYHSCGFILPFIDELIEIGVEVLNPVQPECMPFAEVHARVGDRLSFHGTIGTQTVLPFGTPGEVRDMVRRHRAIAGAQGGLWVAPTHLIEPEVPWANIEALVAACREG